jgi:NAD(P)-dependent dehydrogenase (short-subunit alcohol dehydrogenase family)
MRALDANAMIDFRGTCRAVATPRHALPHIAAGGGATMVMVSSVNTKRGMEGSGAYGISKAALEQMTRQLTVEWGVHNIRINAVSPGTVRTDMVRGRGPYHATSADNRWWSDDHARRQLNTSLRGF